MANFDKVTDILCLADEFYNIFDNCNKISLFGKPSRLLLGNVLK